MPSVDAYRWRLSLTVADQEDGQTTAPVFRDSFDKRDNVNRNGAVGVQGGGNPGVITVPVADTVIVFTGLQRPGHVIIENLDGTNFISYGPESGAAMVKLGELFPGQWDKISLGQGVVLRALADTAPCRVNVKGYEW